MNPVIRFEPNPGRVRIRHRSNELGFKARKHYHDPYYFFDVRHKLVTHTSIGNGLSRMYHTIYFVVLFVRDSFDDCECRFWRERLNFFPPMRENRVSSHNFPHALVESFFVEWFRASDDDHVAFIRQFEFP